MDYAPCVVLLGSLRASGLSAAACAATVVALRGGGSPASVCVCRGALRAKASNIKGRADRVLLTEDAGRSGSQRRVTGVEDRRLRSALSLETGRCRGSWDSWAPRVDSWSSCNEAKGVREVGNPPAARNRATVKTHRR